MKNKPNYFKIFLKCLVLFIIIFIMFYKRTYLIMEIYNLIKLLLEPFIKILFYSYLLSQLFIFFLKILYIYSFFPLLFENIQIVIFESIRIVTFENIQILLDNWLYELFYIIKLPVKIFFSIYEIIKLLYNWVDNWSNIIFFKLYKLLFMYFKAINKLIPIFVNIIDIIFIDNLIINLIFNIFIWIFIYTFIRIITKKTDKKNKKYK